MSVCARFVSVLVLSVALLTGGVGVAGAVVTDSYDSARQVMCSATGAAVDVSYTNTYGNTTSRENVSLRGRPIGGGHTCISVDSRSGEYGDSIGTSISDESGGYVYCAIYVNGRKVAESEDDSSYYSSAFCM
ncbi:hypothetical protein [uncultured Williamsia sp.]|uniref:hypothetical protein n=1 Tax=uncultured Williamsia sp. TaxID=259311 RepID=UPI00262BD959|nr:hypothetical protein [uncultured Williamsia sp.]